MAIKEFYGFEGDNRKFDNVIDAVQEAQIASASQGGARIKVFRSVMYTHSTEPKQSTLTIVEVPPDFTEEMLRNPQQIMGEPRVGNRLHSRTAGVNGSYPRYPAGETAQERALTPSLPADPAKVITNEGASTDPLTKSWKPCYSCGRKK